MRFLFLFFFTAIQFTVQSQTPEPPQKIGHADWQYIFGQMKEYKQIEADLKTFETQLQNQLKLKGQELEAKYKAYQELSANTPETIKKDKESELAYLQENLQGFQQEAQQSLQKKQNDLVTPVFAKVGKATEDVALENSFAYIINPQMVGGGDVLLFSNAKYDIFDMVLKKLGVEVPATDTESGEGKR